MQNSNEQQPIISEVNDLQLGTSEDDHSIIAARVVDDEEESGKLNSYSDKNNYQEGNSSDIKQGVLVDLKLLSYNVFMRPIVKTNKSDYKDARLDELIIKMKEENFDIICLQELFSTASNRLSKLLKEFSDFEHVHLSRNTWKLKPIDSGLVIMSRFPIVERDSFIFSQGSNIDGYTTKGVLSVLLDISKKDSQEKKYLLVFNTHTQANYDLKDESYWKIQQSQVSEMAIFIHRKMKQFSGVSALVCGDFNIDARNKPEWYHWMMDRLNEMNNNEALEALKKQYPLDISPLQGSHISDEYTSIVKELSERKGESESKLSITDLVLEKQGNHPISFGDFIVENGTEKPREVILTNPETLITKERLDYIFLVEPSLQIPTLSVQNCCIEPFFRPLEKITESMPCTQLSDHYAVSLSCTF